MLSDNTYYNISLINNDSQCLKHLGMVVQNDVMKNSSDFSSEVHMHYELLYFPQVFAIMEYMC